MNETNEDQENAVERLMEAYFLRLIGSSEEDKAVDETNEEATVHCQEEDSFDACSCESEGDSVEELDKDDADDQNEVASCRASDFSGPSDETPSESAFVVKLKAKYAEKNIQFDPSEFIRKTPDSEPTPVNVPTERVPGQPKETEIPTPSDFARKNFQFIGLQDVVHQAIQSNESVGAPLSLTLGKLYSSYFKAKNRKVRYSDEDKPLHPVFKEKTVLRQEFQAIKKLNFSDVYRQVIQEMKMEDLSSYGRELEPPTGDSSDFIDSDSLEALSAGSKTLDPEMQELKDELFSKVVIEEGDETE